MFIIKQSRKKLCTCRFPQFFGQVTINKLLQDKAIQIITYIFGIIHLQRYLIRYLVKSKKKVNQLVIFIRCCGCFFVLGHTSRILSLIMSPKGNTIVSLSADETIRFWNCFPIDIQRKKKLEMTRTHSYPTRLNFNCR